LQTAHAPKPLSVCLIGNFPPAASGQAAINETFRQYFKRAGAQVGVVNLSPPPGPRSFGRRVRRLPKAAIGAVRLSGFLASHADSVVYIGVSGRLGQIYDILFALIARLGRGRLYLHHDSYVYLDRPSRLTSLLVRVAGSRATHIVGGCADMGRRLGTLYPAASQIVVVSNVTNTEPPPNSFAPRTRLATVGFISYLSRSKGLLEFLETAEQICSKWPDIRAIVAGPIVDRSIEPELRRKLRASPWLEYVGPVFGERKSLFYESIDLLLFPTRHADEADPRVIYEALGHGVVVVATSRGCIASTLAEAGGIAIPDTLDFDAESMKAVAGWMDHLDEFRLASIAARRRYQQLNEEHSHNLSALLKAMSFEGCVQG
jgi:glycosyltransferase involved in cell wall biosynthesis